jgi:stearoyl-CoA desaturase (delta-9 desaturase)
MSSRYNLSKKHILMSLLRWFDDEAGIDQLSRRDPDRVDWLRVVPFLLLHLACLLVICVGWSPVAVSTAIGLYVVRMLAITGVYHRYFSHRTYKMSRRWQFVGAVIAATSAQRGPIWWAGHHRHHHRYADQSEDIHSPVQKGFLWSHVLWILTPRYFPTNKALAKDWMKYPELVLLNRFSIGPPVALLVLLVVVGELLRVNVPSAGTSGLQMGVWGFCISTVVLFHATATINSLDHLIGRRRYDTGDQSRNNWVLALITFGEGWHNNHHHYPIASRQGFYWWEIDVTYYILVLLSWLGIVHSLIPLSRQRRDSNRIDGSLPAQTAL